MTVDTAYLGKVKRVIDEALAFDDITREVISRFIEKIEVEEVGTVKLFYRFAGTSSIVKALLDYVRNCMCAWVAHLFLKYCATLGTPHMWCAVHC